MLFAAAWHWHAVFRSRIVGRRGDLAKEYEVTIPGTVLESHRYPQHALLRDIVLPGGATLLRLEWEDNCCGLACIQRFWMPKDFLYRLLIPCWLRGLRAEPMMLRKGGYCGIFLNWDVPMAWMARFSRKHRLVFLESLPAVQITPIVSVSCNFPMTPSAKGGHLVVFRGTRVSNAKGEVCYCDDPSTQGAIVDEVERTRFWSSFSGRALILKSARTWQGLSSVIADKHSCYAQKKRSWRPA